MSRDTSRYVVNGERLPSVTEILRLTGIVDFSNVDEQTLMWAGERGRRVHEWCELVDQGAIWTGSGIEEIDQRVESYLEWKQLMNFKPLLTEHAMASPGLGYAGTLDRVGYIGNALAVIDLKCSAHAEPWIGLQLAAYQRLLDDDSSGLRPHARFALLLHPTGAKVREFPDFYRDLDDFTAALRLVRYKIRTGDQAVVDALRG